MLAKKKNQIIEKCIPIIQRKHEKKRIKRTKQLLNLQICIIVIIAHFEA